MTEVEQQDLRVIVGSQGNFFNENRSENANWALHLSMRIYSPLLMLNRATTKGPTENEINASVRKALTALQAMKPVSSKVASTKKHKIGEEDTSSEEHGEDTLAQEPLPLPEPADLQQA